MLTRSELDDVAQRVLFNVPVAHLQHACITIERAAMPQ
jgi:hypothetical protein